MPLTCSSLTHTHSHMLTQESARPLCPPALLGSVRRRSLAALLGSVCCMAGLTCSCARGCSGCFLSDTTVSDTAASLQVPALEPTNAFISLMQHLGLEFLGHMVGVSDCIRKYQAVLKWPHHAGPKQCEHLLPAAPQHYPASLSSLGHSGGGGAALYGVGFPSPEAHVFSLWRTGDSGHPPQPLLPCP